MAQHTLANLRDTQKLTEARWELGAGSELDVQSSRARLKAIEADIPLLEVAETQSRNRLAVLLGQRPETLTAMLAPHDVPAFAKALPLGDTRELLRQRADVRVAERRLAAATARVGVATADLFPRLSLSGFVGFLGGDASGLVNGNNKAWSLTPSLSWAAFDFGTVRARLRASKAEAEGVAAQYEQAVLLALEDTENALTRYSKQQARLAIVVEQAQAARRAESLAQIRYREGSEDFLTLLDAQRTQLAADDALAAAEAEVNVSVVGVYKALGGWGNRRSNPAWRSCSRHEGRKPRLPSLSASGPEIGRYCAFAHAHDAEAMAGGRFHHPPAFDEADPARAELFQSICLGIDVVALDVQVHP